MNIVTITGKVGKIFTANSKFNNSKIANFSILNIERMIYDGQEIENKIYAECTDFNYKNNFKEGDDVLIYGKISTSKQIIDDKDIWKNKVKVINIEKLASSQSQSQSQKLFTSNIKDDIDDDIKDIDNDIPF